MSETARKETVRTTFTAAALIAAVNVASLILDQRDHVFPALMAVDIAHALIAGTIAVVLIRARRPWSVRACDVAFAISIAPFLIGIWLPQAHDLRGGELLEPMLAHHFLLLGIAVAAPSWRIGSAAIVVFTVHAIALWQTLLAAGPSPALDREPWFTLFFGVIAMLLLYTRERRRRLEDRLTIAEARARLLAQVSRLLLALRDRANTPLQTIEIAITLLEQGHDTRATLDMLRRALERLISIQRALAETQTPAQDLIPQDLEESLRELLDGGDLESDFRLIDQRSSSTTSFVEPRAVR
jgi:hypothetical protein